MPSFLAPIIISLDEAFAIFDETYNDCLKNNNMNPYINALSKFIGNYSHRTDLIKKLELNQYNISIRKCQNGIFLDVLEPRKNSDITILRADQIKRIKDFNTYLNTPEVILYFEKQQKIGKYIVLPLILIFIISGFIFVYSLK